MIAPKNLLQREDNTMEQTIGKRIQALRKSRGMTQEQLAEQVGVSAQAVSKWENDSSCPDISLLPKLAELFQVTTDSLLGMPEKAEIVPAPPKRSGFYVNIGDDEEEEDDGHQNGFSFNFDIGSKDLPWFATAVLLFAVGLLLNRTVLSGLGEAGIWDLMWPSAMLALGLSSLWERISLWSVGMTGFGEYYLLVNMHILDRWDALSWRIIVPVLLVFWALSMFADHFTGKHRHGSPKTSNSYSADNGEIRYDGAFGSENVAVTEPVFRGGDVDISFGSYTLDLTACQTVEPGSKLTIDVAFGSVTLKLPRHWKVQEQSDRSFATVTTHGSPDPAADQLLTVESDLAFSSLDIRW